MRRLGWQRGEGRAGCLFWILVLLVMGMAASRIVPVKIATMQLQDHMKDLPTKHPRKDQAFYEKTIFDRARELKLDIPREGIKVRKTTERVIMDVRFSVPLDFIVYEHDWNVEIYQDLDIFYF